MSLEQIVALAMPLALTAVMVPVFRALARKLGRSGGWYAGLAVYWLLWGLLFAVPLLGKEALLRLFRPPKVTPWAVLLAAVPMLFAVVGRFVVKERYEKATRWAVLTLLGTAIGNGLFEELIWRGVYLALFPHNVLLGILWPSLGFGLWHPARPGKGGKNGKASSGPAWGLGCGTMRRAPCRAAARWSG